MLVTSKHNPNVWQLEKWAKGFYSVYGINDDKKYYSDIWLPATSHASTVAEGVRLNKHEDTIYYLGNVLAWVLSFVERFRLDLNVSKAGRSTLRKHGECWTDWILHKFPGVCHICGKSPCICATLRDVMELRKGERKFEFESLMKTREKPIKQAYAKMVQRGEASRTMPQLFDMFKEIYGGTLWGMDISDIAFHFVEEIGEVSKEISYLEAICGGHTKDDWGNYVEITKGVRVWDKYSIVCLGLMHELADVFSWVTALCFKACQLSSEQWQSRDVLIKLYTGQILQDKGRHSVTITGDRIKFVCRYCEEETCSSGCVQKQVRKRLMDGRNEMEKKFAYES